MAKRRQTGGPHEVKPWRPGAAPRRIREKVRTGDIELSYTKHASTKHAKERMSERGLLIGDVIHVPKNGTVYEEAEPATRDGLFKHGIECLTPNSGRRSVRLVVIPSPTSRSIKVITVMWVDGT